MDGVHYSWFMDGLWMVYGCFMDGYGWFMWIYLCDVMGCELLMDDLT